MEGKEVRFGIFNSALFATITTDASCGAVNSMHDSFTALGGFVPLFNIQLGEIIFGGVGAGLYGMLVFVVLAVFIAGLMVGRTPEYLGKKIEAYDVKMAMLSLLILAVDHSRLRRLGGGEQMGTGWFEQQRSAWLERNSLCLQLRHRKQRKRLRRTQANTPWYNTTLGIAMLFGRFLMIVPIMALAGSLVAKESLASERGHISGFRRDIFYSAHWHHPAGRRAEFSSCAHPRTGGGTFPHPARKTLLIDRRFHETKSRFSF